MGRYRKIDPRVWNDARFCRFSDSAKLLWLFILTHPHMTGLGAFRASAPGLAAELGWSAEAFAEAFGEPLREGMLRYDPAASFLWVPNFLKYNTPESPNVVKSWGAQLEYLPECDLRNELAQRVVAILEGMGVAFGKALPETFAKALPNQEHLTRANRNTSSPNGIAGYEDRAGAREVPGEEEALRAVHEGEGKRNERRKPSPTMSPDGAVPSNKSEGMQCFNALRAWWSQNVREEGPLDGWPEWMALREQADYPGDAKLLPVVQEAAAGCRWRRNSAPTLKQFLKNGTWRAQALAKPSASPSKAPSATTDDMPPADTPTTTAPVSVQSRA